MKNILYPVLCITAVVLVSFRSDTKKTDEPVISSRVVTQVAVVVRDIDKARSAWAKILGLEAPEVSIAEGHNSRPTMYRGKPSDAKAKLAFFNLENIQIELIQPLGGNSTW